MAKWLLLLSMLIPRLANAGDGLDVRDWLSRPGVKLLAVEFSSTLLAPQTSGPFGRADMRSDLPALHPDEGAPC